MFESPERDLTPAQQREWRAQYAHGELVADRLHQLVAKGYRPIWGSDTTSYELIHPHKKAIQVDLWPDGQVVDRSPSTIKDGSRTIIAADDAGKFKLFLAAVPKPSWRNRLSAMTIGDAATHVTAWIGLLILCGVSYVVVDWIWRLVGGH